MSDNRYRDHDSAVTAEDSPKSDPWVHRSGGMKCHTCMWYVEKKTTARVNPEKGPIGRCRRHAPTMGGYPVVFATDWCGDHKLDETK